MAGSARMVGDLVRPGQLAEHHDADQHRQPAERRHHQRGQRRSTVRAPRRVVPDQQVGEDGGELPVDVERDQVVGGDQAEHGAGERGQHAGRSGRRVRAGEVPAAVDQDQRPDAADDQRQHPLQHPDPDGQVDAERRDPAHGLVDGAAREHDRGLGQAPDEGGRRREREHEERAVPQEAGEQRRSTRHQEVHGDEKGHGGPLVVGAGRLGAGVRFGVSVGRCRLSGRPGRGYDPIEARQAAGRAERDPAPLSPATPASAAKVGANRNSATRKSCRGRPRLGRGPERPELPGRAPYRQAYGHDCRRRTHRRGSALSRERRRSRPSNEFVIFSKPELGRLTGDDLDKVWDLFAELLGTYDVTVHTSMTLTGPELEASGAMQDHYGVINQISRLGRPALTEPAEAALRRGLRRHPRRRGRARRAPVPRATTPTSARTPSGCCSRTPR